MVVDWMTNLADAIQDGWGVDSSRESARPALLEVITKHSPFKLDTVYMPVPRCETCAHWKRFELEDAGTCSMIGIPTAPAVGVALETREYFGCVQWKEKA